MMPKKKFTKEKRTKTLRILDWVTSLIMMFAIGFGLGTAHPQTPAIYIGAVICICAIAKIELYHLSKKYQRQNDNEPKDEQKE